jgi:hypothetical protein
MSTPPGYLALYLRLGRRHHPPVPPDADEDLVVLHVCGGEITDAGSWVYAWLRVDGDRPVIYVGATGLQPGTRAWPKPGSCPSITSAILRSLTFRRSLPRTAGR